MNGHATRDRVAIVGIGATDYSRNSGRSELQLATEAILAAVHDAGLRADEIDGIVKYTIDSSGDPPTIAGVLGIPDLSFWAEASGAGTGSCAVVGHGVNAIISGQARNVVAFRSLNGNSSYRFGNLMDRRPRRYVGGKSSYEEYHQPFGLFAPSQFFAMLARRHFIDYGTTNDALGAIAVACREHASHNPAAQMRAPITMDDYHNSRWIAEPLHLLDCCLTTDGAAAVVMTSAERAHDLPRPPVYISARGQAAGPAPTPGMLNSWLTRDVITETAGRYLAQKLYAMAGAGPTEMDVVQFYDCFTITVLMQIEDYGFCAKGESAAFIGDGSRLRVTGDLPINTAGGNLSEGYIHGFNHVLEGVRQMRGTSPNQVTGASYCLVTGGAPPATSGLILRRA
jgi:acetyl-CoA acetyltransferase